MRKLKFLLPVGIFAYLLIGVSFFVSAYSADEIPEPTVPTLIGWTFDELWLDGESEFWAGLYNPPLNEAENPYVGKKVCSAEVSLTFPKDLIEITSVSFATNDANNYSNETGVVNFKAILEPCTTLTGIDLFYFNLRAKQIGQGTIQFTKFIVTGGESGDETLQSGIYGDVPINVVDGQPFIEEPEDPLPSTPPQAAQPKVETVTKSSNKSSTSSASKSASSAKATAKTAAKTEDSTLKTPTLTKLEFSTDAVLDKQNQRSQGAIFTGTSDPNTKLYILLHSQSEIYTDTISDANGNWSKKIDGWLEDGTHTITTWSEANNRTSPKFTSSFVISSYAKDQIAIGDTYPEIQGGDASEADLTVKKDDKIDRFLKSKFFMIYVGLGVLFLFVLVIVLSIIQSKKKDQLADVSNDNFSQSLPPSYTIDSQNNNSENDNNIYPDAKV